MNTKAAAVHAASQEELRNISDNTNLIIKLNIATHLSATTWMMTSLKPGILETIMDKIKRIANRIKLVVDFSSL